MAGMAYLFGLRTNDYVLLAADKVCFAHGAIVVTNDHDKSFRLGEKLMMMCIGEDGDVAQFGDYVEKNLQLYKLRNGYEITPRSAMHWIRKAIADNLRSQDHYTVDTLVGGYDEHDNKPFLGSIDYLGNALSDQPYLFRGFSGRFCYAILDKLYRPDMTEEEGHEAMMKCLNEVKKRFVANLPTFQVVMINKDGIRQLDDISV
uniref:Proteasome subunit beta n=2 Tax=Plectus sambesii TaxID=2011161 RepID=A0A914VXB1_9BILA